MGYFTLVVFMLIWLGIALAARRRRFSNVIAIGGGFIGSFFATGFVTYSLVSAGIFHFSAENNSGSANTTSNTSTRPGVMGRVDNATALVGEWSCKSDNGRITRERYSSDGLFSWRMDANRNGDAPVDRAITKIDGNYQLSANKLIFSLTRLRLEFAPEDAVYAQSLSSAGGNFVLVGAREIETQQEGSGGSAIIAIDGDNMQFRTISHIHNGVESSRDGPPDVCFRIGLSRPAAPTAPTPSMTKAASVPRQEPEPVANVVPASPAAPTSTLDEADAAATTVRAFYAALGRGDGEAASSFVIPEKRGAGHFAPESISRFYGSLIEPLQLTDLRPQGPGEYLVGYQFRASSRWCRGRAVVRVTQREGLILIEKIHPLDGC